MEKVTGEDIEMYFSVTFSAVQSVKNRCSHKESDQKIEIKMWN